MNNDIRQPIIEPSDPDKWEKFFLKIAGIDLPKRKLNMFMNKQEYEKLKKQNND